MNRRKALGLIASGGAAAALVPAGCSIVHGLAGNPPGGGTPPGGGKPSGSRFSVPLRIPPVLNPTSSSSTQDEYDIVQSVASQEILPGQTTTIWGYNGIFPGPTIRVKKGRTAVVRHTNRLSTDTVVHLHGGMTPSDSDGFPTDMVMPGQTRAYTYPNQQRACTLWYHDHAMDQTGQNIYMGLAGFYIIDDDEELALPLPKGQFDVPLLLQDRLFNPDGSLLYNTFGNTGVQGDVMVVNGVAWPYFQVAPGKYRFRILNGANARPFGLALSNGSPFILIGTDGGLLPAPVSITNLPIAMAERVDVVIDFSTIPVGTSVYLINTLEQPSLQQLMRLDVTGSAPNDASVPAQLSNPGFLTRPANATTRNWYLGPSFGGGQSGVMWTINGQEFDPNRSDASVPLGEIEFWRFFNNPASKMLHPAHMHLAHFQILERNGGPPLPHETGWKDTVALQPGEEVLVMLRFDQFRGRYLFHCHNLEHEDHSMMSRFDVV